jgi:aspartate/methionine/tyrosine aminotransferase
MIKASERSKNLKSPIRDLVKFGKERERQGKEVFWFNIGDPNAFDFDTPNYLKESLKEVVQGKSGHYSLSEGDQELRKKIAENENKKYKLSLNSDDVIITQGISEGLSFLFGAMISEGKGENVLLPGPTYPIYTQQCSFLGGIPISYKTDEENGWNPDTDDLRSKISDKTKFISVISPNNPTGTVYEKKILQEIINIAGEFKVPLVSDEIYEHLIFGNAKHHNVASLTNDVPVITLNGFSKAYLVPGWRVGYMYFHDTNHQTQEIKEAIKAESRQRLSACTPVMKALVKAFDGPQHHIEELKRKLSERAEFAWKRLNEIEGIESVKPTGAFYIFPKINLNGIWKTDEEFCIDVGKNTGLVLAYGSGFDPVYGKDHFRSVILPPVELMEKAFSSLEDFIKKKKSK